MLHRLLEEQEAHVWIVDALERLAVRRRENGDAGGKRKACLPRSLERRGRLSAVIVTEFDDRPRNVVFLVIRLIFCARR